MTQEERYIKMTETPISRLIPSLAIPTIISMLVTSIYNMADTFLFADGDDPGTWIYTWNGKRKLSFQSPWKPG